MTSANGTDWQSQYAGFAAFAGVGWGGDIFVAVGDGGMIQTSPDGGIWTRRTSGTLNELQAVKWTGNQFVAVGRSGTILTSPDGISWTIQDSGTTKHLDGLGWNSGQIVVVGAFGTLLTSPDGVTWTVRTSGVSHLLWDVVWDGRRFLVVGADGTILTSEDGVEWSRVTSSGAGAHLTGIAWNGTKFVVVGGDGSIFTSLNGVNWTADSSGTTNPLMDVVWNGTEFMAFGSACVLGTSTLAHVEITLNPQPVNANRGESVTFSVAASGAGPLSYQWRRDGLFIEAATAASYGLTGVQPADAAEYSVVVSNPMGSVVSTAAALIVVDPYVVWQGAQFSAADLLDPVISGSDGDPDQDAISNLMEYALGTDPQVPTPPLTPHAGAAGTDWTYSYTRPATRPDLSYLVEISDNLVDWSSSGVTQVRSATGATETWEARYPRSGMEVIFFRLKVVKN